MKAFLRTIGLIYNYNKIYFILLTVLAFLAGVGSLIEPVFFREIINNLLDGNMDSLGRILAVWVGVSVIIIVINFLLVYKSDIFVHRFLVHIWQEIFNRTLYLSNSFYNSQKAGSVMKKIDRGVDSIFDLQLDFIREDFVRIFSFLILIPLLFYLHWKMALVLFLAAPFLIVMAIFTNTKTRKRQVKADHEWHKASGTMMDAFSNISILKSFAIEDLKEKEFAKTTGKAYSEQFKVLKWWAVVIVFTRVTSIVFTIGIFYAGIYFYKHNQINIGEIVMFLSFTLIILSYIQSLFWHFNRFLWHKSKVEDFFEIYDMVPEIVDKKGAVKLDIQGDVEFKNVTFSHDGDIETLKNVSFKAKKGESVALVGHTGSGKSTTVNLISRFYDIQKGHILIDGHEIDDIKLKSLRGAVGMVFQENVLFHETILKNLLIANPKASIEEVRKACKTAECLDFIEKAPKGFKTVVGERGMKLSGGEKQRIAIARVILKDPSILIFDEATSALDAETEGKIQKALEEVMKIRTTFIVAHRLSTIKKADKILVFRNGKIIEEGTYRSLIRQKGHFASLVQAQISGIIS